MLHRSDSSAARRGARRLCTLSPCTCATAQNVCGNATSISPALALFRAAIPEREGGRQIETRRSKMSIGTILLIVLVLLLVGAIPTWGYSSGWGYGPSGGVGLILVIVLILFLLGKI
jgi:uncharacterized protein DUF3309